MEKNIVVDIPEEIMNQIFELAEKHYPVYHEMPDHVKEEQMVCNASFGEGAEAMYRHLSPELEALKRENDVLKKRYHELFEATQRLVSAEEEGASMMAWIDVNEIIDQTPQCG